MLLLSTNFSFSWSHCSCIIFLTSCFMCTFANLMLILILIDGNVYGTFWASQNDEMVNITPHQIPTPCKKKSPFPRAKFSVPHIGTVSPPPYLKGIRKFKGKHVTLKDTVDFKVLGELNYYNQNFSKNNT